MRAKALLAAIGVLCCLYAAAEDQPSTKKEPEQRPAASKEAAFRGKALFVQMNGRSQENMLLQDPEIRKLGDRDFLTGRAVNDLGRVWLPVSDIGRMEEFADLEEMGKRYRIGGMNKK